MRLNTIGKIYEEKKTDLFSISGNQTIYSLHYILGRAEDRIGELEAREIGEDAHICIFYKYQKYEFKNVIFSAGKYRSTEKGHK